MSDYDSFDNVAESDLGAFEEALEISGYDAVTTTQRGMQQDEFLKESGMAIDTVGEAKKIEEKREKREKNSESGIAAAFEAARHHVDNHKYEMKFDGKDYEISHGDLKAMVKNETKDLKDRLKKATTEKERAQISRDIMRFQEIQQRMDEGQTLSEDDLEFIVNDYAERNEAFKQELQSHAKVEEFTYSQDVGNEISRLEAYAEQNPDLSLTVGNSFNAQSGASTFSADDFSILVHQSNDPSKELEEDFAAHKVNQSADLNMNDFGIS
tara:strand:- start:117863 stop:118666 length:804 start_codon:yes stop_codon:yes gene_type:complete